MRTNEKKNKTKAKFTKLLETKSLYLEKNIMNT